MGECIHLYEKIAPTNYQSFTHLPQRMVSETYNRCKNKHFLGAKAVVITGSLGMTSHPLVSKLLFLHMWPWNRHAHSKHSCFQSYPGLLLLTKQSA